MPMPTTMTSQTTTRLTAMRMMTNMKMMIRATAMVLQHR